jgi:hypothetical protein
MKQWIGIIGGLLCALAGANSEQQNRLEDESRIRSIMPMANKLAPAQGPPIHVNTDRYSVATPNTAKKFDFDRFKAEQDKWRATRPYATMHGIPILKDTGLAHMAGFQGVTKPIQPYKKRR